MYEALDLIISTTKIKIKQKGGWAGGTAQQLRMYTCPAKDPNSALSSCVGWFIIAFNSKSRRPDTVC